MDIKEILGRCDHTLLLQTATWEQIREVIDDGIRFGTASVCIPPCYVRPAAQYSAGRVAICTVIGFPNGYSRTEVKVAECRAAAEDGAGEIDMVINVGMLKSGDSRGVLEEINAVKAAAPDRILKVIIETCLLTEEEKIEMCRIVSESDADYIKTSTGFSTGGATREDIALFAAHVTGNTKIKAAGGIASLADAEEFIRLGADRLGTSRIVKIAKSESNASGY